jgi:transcriptional regulator of heat shock response
MPICWKVARARIWARAAAFDDLETKRSVIDLLGRTERAEGVRIFIGSEKKLIAVALQTSSRPTATARAISSACSAW